MFNYIFEKHHNVNQSFVADLVLMQLTVREPFDLHGATWTPLRLMHGNLPILGFRVDHGGASLAYCTDVSSIPPESYPLLEDVDVLVLDALRYRHHPTHMTVDDAIEQVKRLKPKQTYFTHIAHDIRHMELDPKLPPNVHLAYDGLIVNVQAKTHINHP
jgi:phosphoribosyl 1,2-cyclic phosphate phosphodiesterase